MKESRFKRQNDDEANLEDIELEVLMRFQVEPSKSQLNLQVCSSGLQPAWELDIGDGSACHKGGG